MKKYLIALTIASLTSIPSIAENAGSGSYLTQFPGTDKAGRNSYPAGIPQMSGKVQGKPAPTNEWYSNELINNHGDGIFNYPMALKPIDTGLVMIRPIEYQAITAENPVIVGVEGISTPQTSISDFSDWAVTIRWENGNGTMDATIGQGMPMVYYTKSEGSGEAFVTINAGTFKSLAPNIVVATGCYNRSSFALFAPEGAVWTINGNTAKSDLNGKSYWTVAILPDNSDPETIARSWARNAFAAPVNTHADWNYDPNTGRVKTVYKIDTEAPEGENLPVIGLLPHHWANLESGASIPDFTGEFATVRGSLKLAACNSFTTERTFHGILNVLPPALSLESGYDESRLHALIDEVCNNTGFDDWTDSYNDGQLLNRLSQTALVAREIGYEDGANRAVGLLKNQLERWFTANPGDVAFVFYYHSPWNTMIAYPAGHGQDSNLNDHNFHFGYFIDAAATVAFFDPEWGEKWGPMVDLLAADVANTDRDNTLFPYLRSFSPYSGHCWANGFATLGLGNDQESSSEAMMSHAALIKWAEIRGNTELRDAAVWMFTTELSAIQEYWFDIKGRNRAAGFPSVLASRIFANGYDDENFWGGGIAGSYGIQIYPVQPSSSYLVEDSEYAGKLWDSMTARTGILNGDSDPNIWYDSWAQFLAMISPSRALGFYNSHVSKMGGKFGVSHAHTYYWIHSLATIGTPNLSVTADSPVAGVYQNGDVKTYAGANYSSSPKTINFSDGVSLEVAPYSTAFYTDGTPEVATPDTSADPGDGGDEDSDPTESQEVVISGIEASEGTFQNPYTIGFTTINHNSVRITASFGDENAYIGFDGPWLFNETNGFTEIRMDRSGDCYATTLTGLKEGDIIRIRVKIAFAGGLAVTKQLTYEVGYRGDLTEVDKVGDQAPVQIKKSGNQLYMTSAENAEVCIISSDGRIMKTAKLAAGIEENLSVESFHPGIYIIRITTAEGRFVKTIII